MLHISCSMLAVNSRCLSIIEATLLMPEEYDETATDLPDRMVADILDTGILVAFNVIGLQPHELRRSFFVGDHADTPEYNEIRRLSIATAYLYYQLARKLRGEAHTAPGELPSELHGVLPRIIALAEEHHVMNEGRPSGTTMIRCPSLIRDAPMC